MKSFVQELKTRRVYRVAIGYLVASSAFIQVAGTVLPAFHSPEWVQQTLVVVVALTFPVVLVLAWGFDLKNGSVRRTRIRERPTPVTRRRLWVLACIGVLVALLEVAAYRLWRTVRTAPPAVSAPGFPASAIVSEKSIAVLPFQNLSPNQENGYFADGVQEEIITDLAKVAELKVISRTSVMQYHAAGQKNVREIGRQLGVAYLLEGSVQRSGDRVRVTAQLIDARSDTHRWADRYDRNVADVFTLESELAEKIVAELKTQLSPAEKAAIEEAPTSDLAAYELYTRGKQLIGATSFNVPASDNLLEAARLFAEATRLDPKFLLAYCELARAHDEIYVIGADHSPGRLSLAEEALRQAIRIRPDSGEAHLAAAQHAYRAYRDYERARSELARARQTLPNDPQIFVLDGNMDRRQGKWDDAINGFKRAAALDPRNVGILQQLSLIYGLQRRYAETAAVLDDVLKIAPDDVATRVQRASIALDARADPVPLRTTIEAALAANPQSARALADARIEVALCEHDWAAAKKALALTDAGCRSGSFPFPHAWCEGVVDRARGEIADAQAAFTTARVEVAKMVEQQPAYAEALCVLGLIDAALGRKEEAIREGEQAAALVPMNKDALVAVELIRYLALIYAWTGEWGKAVDKLSTAARMPSEVSYGQLRLHPLWEPLRTQPGFDKIVASLAPQPDEIRRP